MCPDGHLVVRHVLSIAGRVLWLLGVGGGVLRGSHHGKCHIFCRIERTDSSYNTYMSTPYLEVVYRDPWESSIEGLRMPGSPFSSTHHSRDRTVCGCALTTDASSKASPCVRHSGELECDCGSDSDTDTSLDLGIFPDLFFVRKIVIDLERFAFLSFPRSIRVDRCAREMSYWVHEQVPACRHHGGSQIIKVQASRVADVHA